MSATLTGLFRAAQQRDGKTACAILADALADAGAPDLGDRLRNNPLWHLHEVRLQAIARGLIRWEDDPDHRKAVEFQDALKTVDLDAIAPLTRDRHLNRKEQAALLRKLLRRLGAVPHVSVTTPRHSMASTVDVRIPAREDYERDANGNVIWGSPAAVANRAAEDTLRAILARAFPSHDDRSDSMTDYYDAKWHITS